jgi:nucleotide-binding universal stress UspA family protein
MFETIVCGITRSETGRAAADAARELARCFGSSLHLVIAFSGSSDPDTPAGRNAAPGRKEAEEFRETFERRSPVIHTHALPGDPSDALLTVAEEVDADVIVVGNKGMRGVHHVLGSVPNSVSHKAECSVLIVNTTR